MARVKKKTAKVPTTKSSSRIDAKRLARIFPRTMGALSRLTHAEDMIHENLPPPQLKVLNILGYSEGPLRMTGLAKTLGINQASLSETVKKLAAHGYVTRQRHADDERVVLIELTLSGKALVVEMENKIHRFFTIICDGLNAKDRKKLVDSHEFIFKTFMDAASK